jgi:L-ascorbate metabolism protein UlaG (beta-lactamase superfamily)
MRVAFSLLALSALCAVDTAAQTGSAVPTAPRPVKESGPPASEPTIEYLANEGVLLTAGDVAILIDALFGDGLPEYPVVARATRDALESGRGRFAEVDLVLVTHAHADHFDPAAVRRHLEANRQAILVAPGDAIDALGAETGGLEALGDRLRRLTLDPGEKAEVEVADVAVEALGLAHADIGHVAYRVELADMTLLHLGDATPVPDDLAAWATTGERPDVALIPFWVLIGKDGAALIDAIGAPCIVAMHLERDGSDLARRLAETVPSAILLDERGKRVDGACGTSGPPG